MIVFSGHYFCPGREAQSFWRIHQAVSKSAVLPTFTARRDAIGYTLADAHTTEQFDEGFKDKLNTFTAKISKNTKQCFVANQEG